MNTTLTSLSCGNTSIASLDVSTNTALTELNCGNTQITALDISNNTALRNLNCDATQITSLDVSNNTELISLVCDDCHITLLDVSNNTVLDFLYCRWTEIPFVDISNCPNISTFSAIGCKHNITLDETGAFDITIDPDFNGIDPTRISNVVGANFSAESGIFDNFTADEVTYTYDCDGVGGHNEIFTLVRTESSSALFAAEKKSTDDGAAPGLPEENDAASGSSEPIDSDLPPENAIAIMLAAAAVLIRCARRSRCFTNKKFRVKRKVII